MCIRDRLSSRYITDRFLPDKAIDLMDEAAAKLRMEVDSVPEELDAVSYTHLDVYKRQVIHNIAPKSKCDKQIQMPPTNIHITFISI